MPQICTSQVDANCPVTKWMKILLLAKVSPNSSAFMFNDSRHHCNYHTLQCSQCNGTRVRAQRLAGGTLPLPQQFKHKKKESPKQILNLRWIENSPLRFSSDSCTVQIKKLTIQNPSVSAEMDGVVRLQRISSGDRGDMRGSRETKEKERLSCNLLEYKFNINLFHIPRGPRGTFGGTIDDGGSVCWLAVGDNGVSVYTIKLRMPIGDTL